MQLLQGLLVSPAGIHDRKVQLLEEFLVKILEEFLRKHIGRGIPAGQTSKEILYGFLT